MKNKKFLVIDLEWNQPVPWLRSKISSEKLLGEIIEIGAVILSIKDNCVYLSAPFHRVVRPVHYTIMNKNVGRVINKKSSDLKNGISFIQAYNELMDWCEYDSTILCAWGNSDIEILKSNLCFHGCDAPMAFDFLDIQPLFSKTFSFGNEQKSVAFALDHLHIPHDNVFHEAQFDAYYTAKILSALLLLHEEKNRSNLLKEYVYNTESVIAVTEKTKTYPDAPTCYKNNSDKKIFCPICKQKTDVLLAWFRMKNAAFYLGKCKEHGYISSRMRMKKNIDNAVYAIIQTKRVFPGEADAVFLRYERYMKSTCAK